jgi:hypothetical protein
MSPLEAKPKARDAWTLDLDPVSPLFNPRFTQLLAKVGRH